MCELLGLSFNKQIRPKISFVAFRRRARYNPHGWGIAFYPNPDSFAAFILKEAIPGHKSELAAFLSRYPNIRSRIFICHVRRATRGGPSYRNTHPFARELFGREYVFAHNGTVNEGRIPQPSRFKPMGNSDSERIFCYLLDRIYERGIRSWSREDFDWLHGLLMEIDMYGTLNIMMSDGEHLFCYTDADGYNTLCYIRREPPYLRIKLRDLDWEIDLNLEKSHDQRGYIVATYPLTNEQWTSLSPGELIVFKDGEMIYRSHREEAFKPTQIDIDILRIIRRSPHRVPLRQIVNRLKTRYTKQKIKHHIKLLLCYGYIRQDRRDRVPWHSLQATFYTHPRKRKEIDILIV